MPTTNQKTYDYTWWAILAGAVGGLAFGLPFLHVMRSGNCASDTQYVSADPCPKGTGLWTVLLIAGAFVAVVALLAGLATATLRLTVAIVFLSASAVLLVDLVTEALGGPHSEGERTVAILFAVLGAVPLAFLLAAKARRSAIS
jgi:hypothetical protein